MSSKYTFFAWEQSLESANEKLVLLKLADMANSNGIVSFELKEITQDCLINEFALANMLTSMANQGLIEKTQVEKRAGREIHSFKLLLSNSQQATALPVVEMTPVTPTHTITSIEQSSAPSWANRSFGIYKVPVNSRDAVWQKFTRENNCNTTNLSRLEREFETWLDQVKQSGEINDLLGISPMQKSYGKKQKTTMQPASSGYISTHDLDEYSVPDWAQQTLLHAGLQVDPNLFWEKFVVYYKSRANEYISKTQLLNKLRYWIVNEKQSMENRRQAEERRKQSYQSSQAQKKNLSPSEEFREYLRSQGKKPNF